MEVSTLRFEVPDRYGRALYLRPLVADDRALIVEHFPLLSERTRLLRFHSLSHELTERELDLLLDLDYHDRFAWGVEADVAGAPVPAAIGRYARYTDRDAADLGLTVVDQLQGCGIGGVLLDALTLTAWSNAITTFDTVVMAENERMLACFRRRGAVIGPVESGVVQVVLELAPLLPGLAEHPLLGLLAAGSGEAEPGDPGAGDAGSSEAGSGDPGSGGAGSA